MTEEIKRNERTKIKRGQVTTSQKGWLFVVLFQPDLLQQLPDQWASLFHNWKGHVLEMHPEIGIAVDQSVLDEHQTEDDHKTATREVQSLPSLIFDKTEWRDLNEDKSKI